MAVCFSYLVKRDLSSVSYCSVAYTNVTFYKVPEQHGHIYPGAYTGFGSGGGGALITLI